MASDCDGHKKSSLKSCLKLNTYQDVPGANFWILENFVQWWQRAWWWLFFPKYNLNNSAASGWLSWILISFLDFVDLVACHDGVIYRHGQTVCKNFMDYIQDWLGLTMVIDSVLAPWYTHLFLHTLNKHSVNWELNVKAIMTVFSLPQKADLIILFTTRVFKWSAISSG